ncbi:MAG: glucose 1-dehydrogenase [Novosphingobium sp.]|nr:glucose 1-dehydrogenase [Novosphingobium sp.]
MRFAGKVALVTGGATGIGRETAIRYARQGAKVTIADINESEARETVSKIADAGGEAIFVRADMTRATDIEAMVRETVRRFGRLDAAFNNAGTPGGFTNVVDCTEEEWDRTQALNLKSVWLCMKHEIPAMLAGGGGAIVNTASEAANHPAPHMASYVATKAGVVGLTRSAAYDFAARGIRVNALLPGPTVTPMLLQGTQGLERPLDAFGARLPINRVGEVREQADAVLFLTSDEASFITGQALSVDGGLNLC